VFWFEIIAYYTGCAYDTFESRMHRSRFKRRLGMTSGYIAIAVAFKIVQGMWRQAWPSSSVQPRPGGRRF